MTIPKAGILRRPLTWVVVVIAAAVLLTCLARLPHDEPVATVSIAGIEGTATDAATVALAEPDLPPPDVATDPDIDDCEPTVEQLFEGPLGQEEIDRMRDALDFGPVFESYRSLSVEQIREMAESGDSIAMVIVGKNYYMQATGFTDIHPLTFINGSLHYSDPPLVKSTPKSEDLSDQQLALLDEAARWHYKAALHGRLFALKAYGFILGLRNGGAVGLNWLTASEYKSLKLFQRRAYHPGNVYLHAVYELAPTLKEGIGYPEFGFFTQNDDSKALARDIATVFDNDRINAGLPLPWFAPSRMTREEILRVYCGIDN